jgi:hypothetical protein
MNSKVFKAMEGETNCAKFLTILVDTGFVDVIRRKVVPAEIGNGELAKDVSRGSRSRV